eukprot:GFYU01005800.1.p1 GENE.GFYU01005800.1~~GFYU01005800.1.p1  ORF type:complete len:712 (+),score=286.13 GFYU01005800.1:172-2307(+)
MIRGKFILAILAMIAASAFVSAQDPTIEIVDAINGEDDTYGIGVGISDVTGPAAEVGMMGYAALNQKTSGIHFRLRSRAYIFEDSAGQRIVYVSADICMAMQSVYTTVLQKLHAKYGGLYTEKNTLISGIHTHSGPAGFSWHILYEITSMGFSQKNFDAITNGIFNSIVKAHNNLKKGGKIFYSEGKLYDANINRSAYSYLQNPEEERLRYTDGDTDKTMNVLRLEDADGVELGALSWFAVHCTSMNNTNTLISGDNKGYASYLFEQAKNGKDSLPGQGPFVAAFPQTNSGDVSPNTMGARCPDGNPCDFKTSTCNGKTANCIAPGPGKDMMESTKIIGTKQFEKAEELYNAKQEVVSGNIDFRQTYTDMTNLKVSKEFTSTGKDESTCIPAYGNSFAAGTTDGPGEFDFTQGTTSPNPFWNHIARFIAAPTKEQQECQGVKPILLDVGTAKPFPWIPTKLPLQVVKLGQIFFAAVPSEYTTMSGRRTREALEKIIKSYGEGYKNAKVIIAGYSGAYTGYTATYEEYQVQRYEAASTAFGPHQLAGYTQVLAGLTKAIMERTPVPAGPGPDASTTNISFIGKIVVDSAPFFKKMGDVKTGPSATYSTGSKVAVEFWGANPRNDVRLDSTYLTVERKDGNGNWKVIANDGNWETTFHWARHGVSESIITITWDIPADADAGVYRIGHFGNSRSILQSVKAYSGYTKEFNVTK